MIHQTEIMIPNGRIKCQAKSEIFKKTKCFRCQQEVYIIYTTMGAKLPVNKIGDNLVSHELYCTYSRYCKEEEARKEAQLLSQERFKNSKKRRRR